MNYDPHFYPISTGIMAVFKIGHKFGVKAYWEIFKCLFSTFNYFFMLWNNFHNKNIMLYTYLFIFGQLGIF